MPQPRPLSLTTPPPPFPLSRSPFSPWAGKRHKQFCVWAFYSWPRTELHCTARTARQLTHLYLTNVKCIFWWTPPSASSARQAKLNGLLCRCLIMHFSKNIPSMSDKLNYYYICCWTAGRHVNIRLGKLHIFNLSMQF